MQITALLVDGRPEEIDGSTAVRRLLDRFDRVDRRDTEPTSTAEHDIESGEPLPGVPEEGQEVVLGLLARNPAATQFVRFLAETTGWAGVRVHGIKHHGGRGSGGLDYTRYLRLRRQGQPFGGFVYAYPASGDAHLRLRFASDDELHALAPTARRVKGHREYGVRLGITDDDTLGQALFLAQRAYDGT